MSGGIIGRTYVPNGPSSVDPLPTSSHVHLGALLERRFRPLDHHIRQLLESLLDLQTVPGELPALGLGEPVDVQDEGLQRPVLGLVVLEEEALADVRHQAIDPGSLQIDDAIDEGVEFVERGADRSDVGLEVDRCPGEGNETRTKEGVDLGDARKQQLSLSLVP